MRTQQKISLKHPLAFKEKLFFWVSQFEEFVWLDSNDYPQKYSNFDAVMAVGAHTRLTSNFENAFSKLIQYRKDTDDFIFGYLGYDLKNDLETLHSENFDGLHFPDLYFFQPKKLFFFKDNGLTVCYLHEYKSEIAYDMDHIEKTAVPKQESKNPIKIKKRISKKQYLDQLDKIQNQIHRGDIYEINFCQEFFAENAEIDPLETYLRLNQLSNPPFAGFMKLEDHFVLSASPERFVKKQGNHLISQPIKGTAKRLKDRTADKQLAVQLANDPKERSENVMIVDLVRNDLAKIAQKGSVKVEELCQVYSFDQVHQLISTITAEVADNTDAVDIVKSLFPMGSMTGAPKLSAMRIIEKTEATKRGVYSGAIGYFTPDGDFDFNVVIRSILYNQTNKYLSYSVGGAITAKSDPEKEYEECLLKAIAMKKALKG